MSFLKLLLYIGIILTIAMTAYATEESENDSNIAIHNPIPYNITLTHSHIRYIEHIEENNVSFHGECDINFKINIAMHHVGVYLPEIEVDESMATLYGIDNDAAYVPTNYTYNNTTKLLFLLFTFDEELSPGLYMLHMKFFGNSTINTIKSLQTSHIAEEGERLWANIMAVPLVAITGRKIPCWGNPHYIYISIKHNHTFKAFSNMPIRQQLTDDDGMVWTQFNTTPPMSICKVIVVLTDFANASPYTSQTINMWCRSHLTWHVKYAESVAERFRDYMALYTNISKKLPEINQIVIPGLSQSRPPGLGIILYNESDVTYDDMTDPTYRQMEVAKIVAHHILNQWFGELVVPLNSTYMWLNEGLTSFFEMYISKKIFPNWRVIDSNVVDTLQGCLSEDTGSTMSSVYRSVYTTKVKHTLFDEEFVEFTPYHDKAQAILRMLQHAVTDEVFRNGILTYLNTYQFKTATSEDLWSAMEGEMSTLDYTSRFDVKEVMDTWMNQSHYPVIIVTRNYDTGETTISQNDFRQPGPPLGAPVKMWWVPITFATKTYPNFYDTRPDSWLSPSRHQIYLVTDPNDWIIVNLQQVGYYRVSYDISNWRKIIQYLRSEEYAQIHVLNRAQIIDDAFALRTRGITNIIGMYLPLEYIEMLSLDLFTFFDLMSYLSKETDYIAWFPVFRNLAKMSKYFPLPESEYFKLRMAGVFDTPFINLWNEEDPNEDIFTTLKRLKISKWACLVGNRQCKEKATAKLNYYLADTENHKLSYWWQNWTFCSGLMTANRNTWDKMMDLYMQKRDKNLLEFLACSENSGIIINYLNIVSSSNSTMQEKDRIFAFKHIIIKHARNDQVLDHILENFESVKPKSLIKAAVLNDIISNVYTETQLDKIKDKVECTMHRRIFISIRPVIESRLIALRNFIESFSPWFINKE